MKQPPASTFPEDLTLIFKNKKVSTTTKGTRNILALFCSQFFLAVKSNLNYYQFNVYNHKWPYTSIFINKIQLTKNQDTFTHFNTFHCPFYAYK